jgi:DNA-binding transcriptional MerR regulator
MKYNNAAKGTVFHKNLSEYFESKKHVEYFNNKKYTTALMNRIGISSRYINFLEQSNLITPIRDGVKGWKKFSFMDVLWLRIIVELRKFGIQKERLKSIREHLTYPSHFSSDEQNYSEYPELEFYTTSFINKPSRIYLVINNNGTSQLGYEVEFDPILYPNDIEAHLKLPLHKFLYEMLSSTINGGRYENPPSKYMYVSTQEKETIKSIRSNNVIQVNLKMKNGHINTIDTTKFFNKIDVNFEDLKKQSKYQNIETIVKGSQEFFKQTIKKKI